MAGEKEGRIVGPQQDRMAWAQDGRDVGPLNGQVLGRHKYQDKIDAESKSPIWGYLIAGGGFALGAMVHPLLGFVVFMGCLAAAIEGHKDTAAHNQKIQKKYDNLLDQDLCLEALNSNPISTGVHGRARIADDEDVKKLDLSGGRGLPLGQGYQFLGDLAGSHIGMEGNELHYYGESHGLIIGDPRSGKGSTMQTPAALEWPDSAIIFDPKGEIAAGTAGHREKELGQEVYCLNPYGLHLDGRFDWGLENFHAGYNPLAHVRINNPGLIDDLLQLAEALIEDEGGSNKHFSDSAKNIIAGILGYECVTKEPGERSLTLLRDVVAGCASANEGEDIDFIKERKETIVSMFQDSRLDNFPSVRRLIKKYVQDNREINSVLSTVDVQTAFLESDAISQCLSKNSFSFADMKERKITVFIMLPLRYLDAQRRFLRLLFMSAVHELLEHAYFNHRCLIMADEFQNLGYMSSVKKIIEAGAGYGLTFYPSINNIGQLKRTYSHEWETFLGSCGFIQLVRAGDLETAKHFSELCGKQTIAIRKRSHTLVQDRKSEINEFDITTTFSDEELEKPLLTAKDLMTLPEGVGLLFLNNAYPTLLNKRERYYLNEKYRGLWLPSPSYLPKQIAASLPPSPNWVVAKD